MAEQTIEERLNELKQKRDHVGDLFGAADLQTLVEAIEYAMSHGGNVSVAITPLVGGGGYKITINDSEGIAHDAIVHDGGDAYAVYESTVPDGQTPMSKSEWLASLKGADGAPGHNPCLGRFTTLPTLSPNPFPDARNGDYIYFDTTDSQTSDPVTYVYYFDGTDWDTTGTLVDVSNPSFSSGQDVVGVSIKDIDGEDDPNAQGVLSAEAGEKMGYDVRVQPMIEDKYSIQGSSESSAWTGSSNKHVAIPVNGGETLTFKNHSGNSYALYFALLTAYPAIPKSGDVPSYLSGYPGRRQLNNGGTFTIPDGTKFLIINNPTNYESVKLNGINVLNGAWSAIASLCKALDLKVNMSALADYEQVANKKDDIVRNNTNSNYVGARALFELFQNIQSLLSATSQKNLFVTKYRGNLPTTGVVPATDSPNSSYATTDYIAVEQGHEYYYKLVGSSSVMILGEYIESEGVYTLNTNGINKVGSGAVVSGIFTPHADTTHVVLCSVTSDMADNAVFFDVTDKFYALYTETVLNSDLTIENTSKNLANPELIMAGSIQDNGTLIYRDYAPAQDLSGWGVVRIPVTAGQVISFGGFYLGRIGYYAFYNGNTIVGTRGQYQDPDGGALNTTQNITVPAGATDLYIDVQTNESTVPEGDTTPYDHLMVNIGSTMLTYEPFSQKITKIKGIGLAGAGSDETLREEVEVIEERVTVLENTDIVEDLPVSDGSNISVGYAYIDSSTGVVKVKMS